MVKAAEYMQHFETVVERGDEYWPRFKALSVDRPAEATLGFGKAKGQLLGDDIAGATEIGGLVTLTTHIDRKTSAPGSTRHEGLIQGWGRLYLAADAIFVGLHGGCWFSPYAALNPDEKFDPWQRWRAGGREILALVPRSEVTSVEQKPVKLLGFRTQDLIYVRGRNPNGTAGELKFQADYVKRADGSTVQLTQRKQEPCFAALQEWHSGST